MKTGTASVAVIIFPRAESKTPPSFLSSLKLTGAEHGRSQPNDGFRMSLMTVQTMRQTGTHSAGVRRKNSGALNKMMEREFIRALGFV